VDAIGPLGLIHHRIRHRCSSNSRSGGSHASGEVTAKAKAEDGLKDQVQAREYRQCCGRIAPGWRCGRNAQADRDTETKKNRGQGSRRECTEDDW
jgi:hypothetical protein